MQRRIVYVTPSLYIAGGVERVLTTKVNYYADVLGYDVTVILTDGAAREPYFPLSKKVKCINLDIGFEEMWNTSFLRKGLLYLRKQRMYRKLLRDALMRLHPDITISTGRREVNFLCDIPDGSVKLCEIHVNRAHYRNFEGKDANPLKNLFARCWMHSLVKTLRRFDRVVCLTETDARSWHELSNVTAIPNPLSSAQDMAATKTGRRVIAVGRYVYEKGFDMLIDAWASVQAKHPNWQLDVFGTGDRTMYQHLVEERGVAASCHLHDADPDIAQRYAESDILAVSSRFEGFGMIIIEAMAEGCVPVSFNCPYGPASIIHDGKDGLLVEDGNVEAMAATLCRVMEREEERAAMSRAAKQTAAQYLIENIAERWIALFDSLCPKR